MSSYYKNAKYMAVAELIARNIRSGDLPPSNSFYSRDELARAYHISPGTACSVLRELERRGVIQRHRGKRAVLFDETPGFSRSTPPARRPVFIRDSSLIDSPEYDFVLFYAKNLLRPHDVLLHEVNASVSIPVDSFSSSDLAFCFPSAAQVEIPSFVRRFDVVVGAARDNAVCILTQNAGLDCIFYLIKHKISRLVHVTSPRAAVPWFGRLTDSGIVHDFISDILLASESFTGDSDEFPLFLTASLLPRYAPNHIPVGVMIDDPYLSDFISGEIASGAFRPPSGCTLFGTMLSGKKMRFPCYDLQLDKFTRKILHLMYSCLPDSPGRLPGELHIPKFCDSDTVV